jgi:prepilin-type N-terminal cleavage/methylation domain-containing protein
MKGFTLVEVLLSIAAMTIIAGISVPIYRTFQIRNGLDIAAVTIAQGARRAQTLAEASDGDSSWGIRVGTSTIVMFRGESYAARNGSFDETFEMPASVTPSGLGEVAFAKFTGEPLATGSIILTTNTNETRTITINAKGMVEY